MSSSSNVTGSPGSSTVLNNDSVVVGAFSIPLILGTIKEQGERLASYQPDSLWRDSMARLETLSSTCKTIRTSFTQAQEFKRKRLQAHCVAKALKIVQSQANQHKECRDDDSWASCLSADSESEQGETFTFEEEKKRFDLLCEILDATTKNCAHRVFHVMDVFKTWLLNLHESSSEENWVENSGNFHWLVEEALSTIWAVDQHLALELAQKFKLERSESFVIIVAQTDPSLALELMQIPEKPLLIGGYYKAIAQKVPTDQPVVAQQIIGEISVPAFKKGAICDFAQRTAKKDLCQAIDWIQTHYSTDLQERDWIKIFCRAHLPSASDLERAVSSLPFHEHSYAWLNSISNLISAAIRSSVENLSKSIEIVTKFPVEAQQYAYEVILKFLPNEMRNTRTNVHGILTLMMTRCTLIQNTLESLPEDQLRVLGFLALEEQMENKNHGQIIALARATRLNWERYWIAKEVAKTSRSVASQIARTIKSPSWKQLAYWSILQQTPIEEVPSVIEMMPSSERDWAYAELAKQCVCDDLERAMGFLQKLNDKKIRDEMYVEVLSMLANHDAHSAYQAQSYVERICDETLRQDLYVILAEKIASQSLKQALEIIEKITSRRHQAIVFIKIGQSNIAKEEDGCALLLNIKV